MVPNGRGLSSIAQSLKETNRLLTLMAQRMDKVDERIGDIELNISKKDESSSPCTPSRSRTKPVPTEVRVINAP